MSISEQAKTHLIELLYEGETLDAFDLEAFYGWVEASYQALMFDPVQQERFAEYCGSSCDSTSMRLCGVWMLKQALYKDTPKDYTPTHSQA